MYGDGKFSGFRFHSCLCRCRNGMVIQLKLTKKRVIAFILVSVLFVSLFPTSVFASGEEVVPPETISESRFPSKFDLRDLGVVTPVKQQSPWGTCWAFSAIAAAETSILTAMGKSYEETGLDLSERHLAWYVTRPVTEDISASQAGEGLHVYNTAAGPNHVFDFGGKEQCAATLFAQGIGPVSEGEYPFRGEWGRLAFEDLSENKEAYIEYRTTVYRDSYWYLDEETLRELAEADYRAYLAEYEKYNVYSPLDDWSINEPDEPGSGKLRGSAYTLTDNNVFTYWERMDPDEDRDSDPLYDKEPLYTRGNVYNLYRESLDLIKAELYKGHGVSIGIDYSPDYFNYDTWASYSASYMTHDHVVCVVGWDDDYPASNFKTTPPGNGAWIVKNSWGSQTDAVPGGLVAPDGTVKDANESDWGYVDENGLHTGYFYLSYYDSGIGVPESYEFQIKENNDQRDALQLDYMPASVVEWSHTDEKPMWEANIFTLDKDMRIDEVATRIRMSESVPVTGFTVRFDLYRLREGAAEPDDGELISTAVRTFENQGYHRTSLDAPVYLKAGDRLGIVVQQTHICGNGTTVYGAEAQEADRYRNIHSDPVYGTPVINEGESFWKLTGVTDLEEEAQDGWLDMTAPLSEELLSYLRPDISDNPSMAKFYFSRYCGHPINDFFGIDNFCIKAFGEPCTLEYVEGEEGCVEHWVDPDTGAIYADEFGTIPLYKVTVTGGIADPKLAKAGETVTVKADVGRLFEFVQWIVTDGSAEFMDICSPETSFTMPGGNVSLKAVFKDINDPDPHEESHWTDPNGNDWIYNSLVAGRRFNPPNAGIPLNAENSAVEDVPAVETSSALPFTDVDPLLPLYDIVEYVYENGIMNGVSETLFDPYGTLTRGMVVTILYRMEGSPEVQYTSAFTDIPDGVWYTDGVEWAASHSIVLGYGNGKFGPDDDVTREQLAAILFRYANWKGYDTSIGEDTNILSYYDAFTWGEWAVPALQWACGTGVLEDVPAGMLRPTDVATRGEVAHAIHVFCEEVAK